MSEVQESTGKIDESNNKSGHIPNVIGKWVSVKERLPESHGLYIVYDGHEVWVARYYKIQNIWKWINTTLAQPTYWMPLPTFPLQEAIVFEPTGEQIEQASMEYAKLQDYGLSDFAISICAKGYKNAFIDITKRLKKIIGENVR